MISPFLYLIFVFIKNDAYKLNAIFWWIWFMVCWLFLINCWNFVVLSEPILLEIFLIFSLAGSYKMWLFIFVWSSIN
jgi:hypothetical protein